MESYNSISIAIYQLEEAIKQANVALMTLKKEQQRGYDIKRKQKEEKRQEFLASHKNSILPRFVEIADIAPSSLLADEDQMEQMPLDMARSKFLGFFDKGVQDVNRDKNMAEMKNRLNSLREGDILNISDYRGNGFYYVYIKDNRSWLKRTEGEGGYYLPREALPILHKFKLETLSDIEQVYPHDILGINLGTIRFPDDYLFTTGEVVDEEDKSVFRLADHPL